MARAVWILALLSIIVAGCRGPERTGTKPPPVPMPIPAGAFPMAPGGTVIPPPAAVPGAVPAPVSPGGAFPTAPAPGAPSPNSFYFTPPGGAPTPLAPAAPADANRVEFRWTPVDPAAPEKKSEAPPKIEEKRVQLGPPEPLDDAKAKLLAPKVEDDAARTPLKNQLPAGIPHFMTVRPGLAAGYRPSLDEGLDWLQANGYKAVLHVRVPGETDDSDRRQVEKRGLKYLSVEVAPTTLTRTMLEEFAVQVKDAKNGPLFVYDADGSLAGSLWYWQFRTVDLDSDETARIRATALGLRETGEGRQRDLFLAVQKILSEQ